MGAWGTGIWDNDTACDIDCDFKDLLKECDSKKEAVASLIELYKNCDDTFTMMAIATIQIDYNAVFSEKQLIDALNEAVEEREKYLDEWNEPELRKKVIDKFELKVRNYLEVAL